MSATVPFVFISACTRDLQQARLVLRDALLSLGCHPVLQDHFEVTPGEPIVAKLRRKITDCDYVIHLAGKCYGAAPGERHGGEERSYTQIEYHLAQELGIKTFAFLCAKDFPYAAEDVVKYPAPESDHARDLQQRYCDMLRRRPDNPEYASIRSLEQAADILGKADIKFNKLTDRVLASDKETREHLSRIEALIRAGAPPAVIWNEPRRAKHLFGRVQESADVRQLLMDHGRVAILGSGGKGKTALAAEVLHQLGPPAGHSGPYARRLLLHDFYVSPGHDAVLPGLLSQAGVDVSGMDTATMTERLRSQLGQPGTHLYLEGCEKAAELHRLTALAGSSVILLTTRDAVAPDGFTGYTLPQLSDEEGAALIASLAPAAGDCVPLAHFLGGHALACSQAGHVLARKGGGAGKLLAALQSEGLDKLGGEQREHASIGYLLGHTWELAEAAAPGSADVWTVLALGALAPLPYSILVPAAGLEESALETALETLQRQGIVRVEPIPSDDAGTTEPHWSLDHPLMREFVMQEKSPHQPRAAARYPAWREAWFAFFDVCWDAGKVPGGWQRYERLVPHFDALLEAIALREAADAFPRANVLNYVATMHQYHGRYLLAKEYFRRNLTWCEQHRGPEHQATLNSMANLAVLMDKHGDLTGAGPLLRRCLEARERTLGPEHQQTLCSIINLANWAYQSGKLAVAESLYRRALDGCERTLGFEHSTTLDCLNNLATLLYQRHDLPGAEAIWRNTLEVRERAQGPEHPHTLANLNNLGILLVDRDEFAGAEPLLRRALEVAARTHGSDHPDTVNRINNLGILREKQGRLAEAEALYVQAAAGAQKLLQPEHPDRQGYERNLARVRAARGKDGG